MTPFAAVFRRRSPLTAADIESLRLALGDAAATSDDILEAKGFQASASLGFARLPLGSSSASAGSGPADAANGSLDAPAGPVSVPRQGLLPRADERGGEAHWHRLTGPFGRVDFDPDERRLTLACDALGRRPLYYFERDDLVVVASEVETILRWPGGKWNLDPEQLARFFALEPPANGRTFFRGVHQVEMGTVVVFRATGREVSRFWDPLAVERSELRGDSDFAAAFFEHLRRAVDRELGDPALLGVMLSGGLDSTSLAMLAANATEGQPARIAATSWVFDELEACDERGWMSESLAGEAFEVIRVVGDRSWPFCDPERFSNLAGTPEENPYRALKEVLYESAVRHGRRRLWNGGPADVLQRGGNLYLRDLVLAGRWLTATSCLRRQARLSGPRSALAALARIAWPAGWGRRKGAPRWLTPRAASWFESAPLHLEYPSAGARDVSLFLRMQSRSQSLEAQAGRRCGVEVSSPFWTREFVEFALSLPSHAVVRPGITKFVAREAVRGVVPESIRRRQGSTHLDPLFDRGMFEHEADRVRGLLDGGTPAWNQFVDPDFVRSIGSDSRSAHKVILWRCASFEHWRRKHGWEVDW